LTAGLDRGSAWVIVGPPLFARDPSIGFTPVRSVFFDNPQDESVE
jgi:hypothetical protein